MAYLFSYFGYNNPDESNVPSAPHDLDFDTSNMLEGDRQLWDDALLTSNSSMNVDGAVDDSEQLTLAPLSSKVAALTSHSLPLSAPFHVNKALLRTDVPAVGKVFFKPPPCNPEKAHLIVGLPQDSSVVAAVKEETFFYNFYVYDGKNKQAPRIALPIDRILLARSPVLLSQYAYGRGGVRSLEVRFEVQLRFLLRPTKMFEEDPSNRSKPEPFLHLDMLLVIPQGNGQAPIVLGSSDSLRLIFNNNEGARKRKPSDSEEPSISVSNSGPDKGSSTHDSSSNMTDLNGAPIPMVIQQEKATTPKPPPKRARPNGDLAMSRSDGLERSKTLASSSSLSLSSSMLPSPARSPAPLALFAAAPNIATTASTPREAVEVTLTCPVADFASAAVHVIPVPHGGGFTVPLSTQTVRLMLAPGDYHVSFVVDGVVVASPLLPCFFYEGQSTSYNKISVATPAPSVEQVLRQLTKHSQSQIAEALRSFTPHSLWPKDTTHLPPNGVHIYVSGTAGSLALSWWQTLNEEKGAVDNPFLFPTQRVGIHSTALTPTLTLSALVGTDASGSDAAIKKNAAKVANVLRQNLDKDRLSGVASALVVAVAFDAHQGDRELSALSEVLRIVRTEPSPAGPPPRFTVAAMTSDATARLSTAQLHQRTASLVQSLSCTRQEVLAAREDDGKALAELLGLTVRRAMDEALNAAQNDDSDDEEDEDFFPNNQDVRR